MLCTISDRIVQQLLKWKIIVQEEYEIYLFGVQQLISNILNVLSAIIIGLITREVLPCMIFLICFTAIRQYAGGYHASTRPRCYLLSMSVVAVVLAIIRYVTISFWLLVGLLIIASLVILLLSPVDTENKRLDNIEQNYYRRKAIVIWGIESIAAALCILFEYECLAESIVFALVVLSIAQVAEAEKNRVHQSEEELVA